MLPSSDHELVQIVDASLADATRRARKSDGTSWLACRPGCTPCCHGVFRISPLDAARLRAGLAALHASDPAKATAIQARAQQLTATLGPHFPGDPATGVLASQTGGQTDDLTAFQTGAEAGDETDPWDTFADLPAADAPCPVLDPATGTCDLYAARPLTCRIFGPPVLNDGGIGICELCYQGASEAEILHGEMHLTHQTVEAALERDLPPGETVIAWAVLPI